MRDHPATHQPWLPFCLCLRSLLPSLHTTSLFLIEFFAEPSEINSRLQALFTPPPSHSTPPHLLGSVVDLGVLPSTIVFRPLVPSVFFPSLPFFSIDLQSFIPRVPQFIFSRSYFLSVGMKRLGAQRPISLRLTGALFT